MKKLIALTSHLKTFNFVAPEYFESWVEDAETPLLFDDHEHGLECSRVPYTGRFYLERYTGNAQELQAAVLCWLMEHDEGDDNVRTREELNPPKYNITPNDEAINAFDIDISIEFIERIFLIEDELGPYEYRKKRWKLGDYDLWIAEQAEVTGRYKPNEGNN